MSSEALAWAFKQDVKPSGAKFTLVALCECANYKTGRITPSIAHLVEITGQNRKSIIAHVAQLEAQGYITDTGERCGLTKQIKVYEAALGTVPKAEPSQERNSSTSAPKQSQKRDTEPSWEPSSPSEKQTHKRAHVLPDDWKPVPFAIGSKSRAVVDGWPPGEADAQLEHFTAHHRGKGNRFTDWQDAWSTWVLNSRRFRSGGNERTNNRGASSGGARADGAARALDRQLGLGDFAPEAGRRDSGEGQGNLPRALAGPGTSEPEALQSVPARYVGRAA